MMSNPRGQGAAVPQQKSATAVRMNKETPSSLFFKAAEAKTLQEKIRVIDFNMLAKHTAIKALRKWKKCINRKYGMEVLRAQLQQHFRSQGDEASIHMARTFMLMPLPEFQNFVAKPTASQLEEMIKNYLVSTKDFERNKGKLPPLPPILDPKQRIDFAKRHVAKVTSSTLNNVLKSKKLPYKVDLKNASARQLPALIRKNLTERTGELIGDTWKRVAVKFGTGRPSLLIEKEQRRQTVMKEEMAIRYFEKRKEKPLHRFRRCTQVVITVIKVFRKLRALLMEKGNVIEADHKVYNPRLKEEINDVLWDISEFKSKKNQTMDFRVRLALETLPEYRTRSQVNKILPLLSDLSAVKNFSKEMLTKLAEIAIYLFVGERRLVVKKGDPAWTVYFVYSGCVSVSSDDEADHFKTKNDEVMYLRRGEYFGEVGVLQNIRRVATVATIEDTELIVVYWDDFFAAGLHGEFERNSVRKMRFFRELPMFDGLPDTVITDISNLSRLQDYGYNETILANSKDNYWLWFVESGIAEILRFLPIEALHDYKLLRLLPCNRMLIAVQNQNNTTVPGRNDKISAFDQMRFLRYMTKARWKKKDENKLAFLQKDKKDDAKIEVEAEHTRRKPLMRKLKPTVEGVYTIIDRYMAGMCFGLELVYDERNARKFRNCLISRRCSVIQVPVSIFVMNLPEAVLMRLTVQVKSYPTNNDLLKQFVEESVWETYKRSVVEDVLIHKLEQRPLLERRRAVNLKHFAERRDLPDPTYDYAITKEAADRKTAKRKSEKSEVLGPGGLTGLESLIPDDQHRVNIPYGLEFSKTKWSMVQKNIILKEIPGKTMGNVEALFQPSRAQQLARVKHMSIATMKGPATVLKRTASDRLRAMPIAESTHLSSSPYSIKEALSPKQELASYAHRVENPFPGMVRVDRDDEYSTSKYLRTLQAQKDNINTDRVKKREIAFEFGNKASPTSKSNSEEQDETIINYFKQIVSDASVAISTPPAPVVHDHEKANKTKRPVDTESLDRHTEDEIDEVRSSSDDEDLTTLDDDPDGEHKVKILYDNMDERKFKLRIIVSGAAGVNTASVKWSRHRSNTIASSVKQNVVVTKSEGNTLNVPGQGKNSRAGDSSFRRGTKLAVNATSFVEKYKSKSKRKLTLNVKNQLTAEASQRNNPSDQMLDVENGAKALGGGKDGDIANLIENMKKSLLSKKAKSHQKITRVLDVIDKNTKVEQENADQKAKETEAIQTETESNAEQVANPDDEVKVAVDTKKSVDHAMPEIIPIIAKQIQVESKVDQITNKSKFSRLASTIKASRKSATASRIISDLKAGTATSNTARLEADVTKSQTDPAVKKSGAQNLKSPNKSDKDLKQTPNLKSPNKSDKDLKHTPTKEEMEAVDLDNLEKHIEDL